MPPSPSFHVGYVLKRYPRLSETFIVSEILGLEAAGAAVSIFSLRQPDDARFHREVSRVAGEVEYLPDFRSVPVFEAFDVLRRLGDRSPAGLAAATRFLALVPAERRAPCLVQALHLVEGLERRRVDHLHAHFMTVAAHTTYLAHLFTGLPFTVTAHAKDVYRQGVNPAAFAAIARAARRLVTVCDANRRFIEERFLNGNGNRVVRVYNGIALDELDEEDPPARDPRLVLGVGRLVEKKGFHVLLEASRRLLDRGVTHRVVLIGDGDQRPRLLADRERLGLAGTVELVGPQPRDAVLDWMRRARALASPCVVGADGNRDALPTVLLEALAVGLPAVATPVGGITEIVEDGADGLVVAEGDTGALAGALERLLTDDGLWNRLGAAGRAKCAACFDRNRTVPALLQAMRGAPAEADR